jgi:hypothetical protein
VSDRNYHIRVNRQTLHRVTAALFNQYLAEGLTETVSRREAQPRRGVVAFVRGGQVCFYRVFKMGTFCASWWRAWLYRVDTVTASQALNETWEEKRDRVKLEQERDAQAEATLWRIARSSKGKNEFAWIEPERKAEILKAFGRELAPAVEQAPVG